MAASLSLQHLPGETRAFLFRDERLEEFVVERDGEGARLGDRFLGRVTRVDRRLSGAFVALGEGPDGLLPLTADAPAVSDGDRIVVAVTRVASEEKGPRLALCPGETACGEPRRLAAGIGAIEDLLSLGPETIETDHADLQRRLRAAGHDVRLLPEGFGESRAAAFDAAVEALLRPAVALPGGGSLLIESGRTLTAIDVNLGDRLGAEAALEANRAAAAELVRQLRLRALGGRIVIDFLESGETAVRRASEASLKAAFAADRERVKFIGWSRGGLYELTRRRGRPSLPALLLEPDPAGYGWRKRPLTLAFEALRALALAARHAPGRALVLAAEPALAATIQALPALADLRSRLGVTIEVEARPLMARPAGGPFTIDAAAR